jgi:hypothetical protein
MKTNTLISVLDLQLFADGSGASGASGAADGGTAQGSGVTETAAVSRRGVKNNPLANVKYGIQEDSPQTADAEGNSEAVQTENSPEDRSAAFESLIKGEYKDLYDAKVQDTVQKRLKSTKDTVAKYEALTPMIEVLARKYGVDASNVDALVRAVESDDTYYEDEALRRGVPVDEVKESDRILKENRVLKQRLEDEAAARNYSMWMQQAEQTKSVYPNFDMDTELQNPEFKKLLRSNVDVRTAFEVLHKDEIIPAAMQYTAKQVEQKLTNKVIANGARPTENGISDQSSAVVKSDVSQLSKADRQEIARRVQRGEKIRF